MSSKKLSSITFFVAFGISVLASSASAQLPQTYDKKVYFTFSGPVEVPGATLPAGKYLFHLTDPSSSRQVIQVQSADGKKVFSQFFTMTAERPKASDDPEVRFMETAAGNPPAISTLWYAGERSGKEFVYPRSQALRIAKTTNQPVLTTKAETTKAEEAKSGDLTHVSASGSDAEVAANAEPSGRLQHADIDNDQASSTPVATAGQTTPTGRTTPARSRLPQTASNMPFLLMLAVGLFTATVTLRLSRTGWM